MPDLLIAFANAGLAIVFFPTVWRNVKSGSCGIPLWTSIPRTSLITMLCVTYLFMGLWLAGTVLFVDIGCWLVLIWQRIWRHCG